MKQGWEIKKLGEVCTIQTGKLDANAKVEEGAYPFYTCDSQPYRIDTYAFDDEAILISGNGSQVGHVNYYKGKFNAYQRTYVLTKFSSFDIPFLIKYLKGYLRGYIWDNKKGGCIPYITLPILKNFQIPCPPLPEQEKIVSELDCLSGIIEKKRQQLKELDALAQSIFYEMFGNPLKDEKGWGVKKIKEVCIVNPPKKETSKGLSNSDIVSFLPMEDLPIKACYYSPELTRIFSEVQSSYTCFADNDVLMAKVTPCFENGKIGIAQNLENGVGYGSSEFIVIRTDGTNITKEYIYFIIQDATFIDNACAQLTGTSGLRRVPKQYVEDCYITIPPLSLQQSFASKIESIEQQKALIKQSIVEVETLFNSRMDYYFN